jgi:hypothetical protein
MEAKAWKGRTERFSSSRALLACLLPEAQLASVAAHSQSQYRGVGEEHKIPHNC